MQRNLEEQRFRAVRRGTGVTRVSVRARDLVDQSKSTSKRLRANSPKRQSHTLSFLFERGREDLPIVSYKTLYNTFINVSCIDQLQEESAQDNQKGIKARQRTSHIVQESWKRSNVRKGKKEQWPTQSTNQAKSTSYSMDWERIARTTRNV